MWDACRLGVRLALGPRHCLLQVACRRKWRPIARLRCAEGKVQIGVKTAVSGFVAVFLTGGVEVNKEAMCKICVGRVGCRLWL